MKNEFYDNQSEVEKNKHMEFLLSFVIEEDLETEKLLGKLSVEYLSVLYKKLEFIDFNDENFNKDYEYAGHFILTINKEFYSNICNCMCCGIYDDEIVVGDNKFYFAFDYGH